MNSECLLLLLIIFNVITQLNFKLFGFLLLRSTLRLINPFATNNTLIILSHLISKYLPSICHTTNLSMVYLKLDI
jgi:hypothetical protein